MLLNRFSVHIMQEDGDQGFTHKYPSGVGKPGRADEVLTRRLKEALALATGAAWNSRPCDSPNST